MLIQLFTHKLLRNYLQGLGKASASLIIHPCLPKDSLSLPCKLAFSTLYLSFGLNIMSPATYNISLSWWLGSWSNNHLPSLLQNDKSHTMSHAKNSFINDYIMGWNYFVQGLKHKTWMPCHVTETSLNIVGGSVNSCNVKSCIESSQKLVKNAYNSGIPLLGNLQ